MYVPHQQTHLTLGNCYVEVGQVRDGEPVDLRRMETLDGGRMDSLGVAVHRRLRTGLRGKIAHSWPNSAAIRYLSYPPAEQFDWRSCRGGG